MATRLDAVFSPGNGESSETFRRIRCARCSCRPLRLHDVDAVVRPRFPGCRGAEYFLRAPARRHDAKVASRYRAGARIHDESVAARHASGLQSDVPTHETQAW